MWGYPEEAFTEGDEAGDVENGVWRKIVDLRTVHAKQAAKEWVNGEGEPSVHMVKEAYPLVRSRRRLVLLAGQTSEVRRGGEDGAQGLKMSYMERGAAPSTFLLGFRGMFSLPLTVADFPIMRRRCKLGEGRQGAAVVRAWCVGGRRRAEGGGANEKGGVKIWFAVRTYAAQPE